MEDIWKGAFSPSVQKHKLGTHDVYNHFRILYVVRAEEAGDYLGVYTDDEFEATDGMTLEDLHRLGQGRYEWLVGVGFLDGDPTVYNWIIARETAGRLTDAKAYPIMAEEILRIAHNARLENGEVQPGFVSL